MTNQSRYEKWWDAAKTVILPFSGLVGVALLILVFAGEQWVRKIAREEAGNLTAGTVSSQSDAASLLAEHGNRLVKVESTVENHEDDIEDNEEEVKDLRGEFRQFIQRVIDHL